MKKSAHTNTKKKSVHTKRPSAKRSPPSSGAGTSQPLVTADPVSKQQAAKQAGMFLYTDDSWSARYWNSNDLHCLERELFG